jgi:energy-coupling factor transporter ATP-binding protein EcfA2
MLSVRGLRKRFGEQVAVDGVGFTIKAGEIYGLLGPNGAGKTTSLSMIAGILARAAGEVEPVLKTLGCCSPAAWAMATYLTLIFKPRICPQRPLRSHYSASFRFSPPPLLPSASSVSAPNSPPRRLSEN